MASKASFRCFFFLLFLCVATTFMKSIELMNHHEMEMVRKESIGNIAIKEMTGVGVEPLEHEAMFIDTLKDCMPGTETKECKTFIPNGSKERIAVLTPPGKMAVSLLKFINIVLMEGKKGKDGDFASTQVDVIPTTHMAPYGYGKTHGYTRIIRIVPQPLLLGATDTLKAALQSSPSLSLSDVTLNDLKAALRQQIRYHCRLNHIAAHTAMWTIGVEDVEEMGTTWLVETAQNFFGLDIGQDGFLDKVYAKYEGAAPDDDDDKSNQGHREAGEEDDDDDDIGEAHFDHMVAEGSRVMSLVQKQANAIGKEAKAKYDTNDIFKILDDVLLDEMRISKNLTAWPCESFWSVGEPENRLEISPVIQSISRAMSPNCTAPYTSCFVKKDKCEAKGDGKCK